MLSYFKIIYYEVKMKKQVPFIGLLLCAVAAASYLGYSPKRVIEYNYSDAKLGVEDVRQLVTEDNTTQRTIMFSAKEKKPFSIEYKKKSASQSKIVKANDKTFKNKYEYILYSAKLKQLEPNTQYEYRIVTTDNRGTWHKLETDNKKGLTALIFADSQSADYSRWRKLAYTAYSNNKNAQLYLNLGDQVDNGEAKWHWDGWLSGIAPFSAEIPMATLIGNHELYNENYEESYPETHLKFFDFPAPIPKYKNQFYSFDYGPVHFVVLDTNHRDEMLKHQPNLPYAQLHWLRSDLANCKAKWKVALMHRDILMYGYDPSSGYKSEWRTYIDYSGKDFMPIFDTYGVDAVLSGHMHTYRRRTPLKYFNPHKKGTTYIMSGVSGDQTSYSKLWEDFSWDVKRAPSKPEEGNYMTMTVDDKQLVFKAFLPDGKQFDEVVIKK